MAEENNNKANVAMNETLKYLRKMEKNGCTISDLIGALESRSKPAGVSCMAMNVQPEGDQFLEMRASRLLRELKMPTGDGYKYILAIIILINEGRSKQRWIIKELYLKVADMFGTTTSHVRYAIIRDIEMAWNYCTPNVRYRYFGNTISKRMSRPNNTMFIKMMMKYLQHDSTISSQEYLESERVQKDDALLQLEKVIEQILIEVGVNLERESGEDLKKIIYIICNNPKILKFSDVIMWKNIAQEDATYEHSNTRYNILYALKNASKRISEENCKKYFEGEYKINVREFAICIVPHILQEVEMPIAKQASIDDVVQEVLLDVGVNLQFLGGETLKRAIIVLCRRPELLEFEKHEIWKYIKMYDVKLICNSCFYSSLRNALRTASKIIEFDAYQKYFSNAPRYPKNIKELATAIVSHIRKECEKLGISL